MARLFSASLTIKEDQPHNDTRPQVHYILCIQDVFPSRGRADSVFERSASALPQKLCVTPAGRYGDRNAEPCVLHGSINVKNASFHYHLASLTVPRSRDAPDIAINLS